MIFRRDENNNFVETVSKFPSSLILKCLKHSSYNFYDVIDSFQWKSPTILFTQKNSKVSNFLTSFDLSELSDHTYIDKNIARIYKNNEIEVVLVHDVKKVLNEQEFMVTQLPLIDYNYF